MCIKRDKPGGLGLSVKGGAEHNLPILISRIFKDQAGICSDFMFKVLLYDFTHLSRYIYVG